MLLFGSRSYPPFPRPCLVVGAPGRNNFRILYRSKPLFGFRGLHPLAIMSIAFILWLTICCRTSAHFGKVEGDGIPPHSSHSIFHFLSTSPGVLAFFPSECRPSRPVPIPHGSPAQGSLLHLERLRLRLSRSLGFLPLPPKAFIPLKRSLDQPKTLHLPDVFLSGFIFCGFFIGSIFFLPYTFFSSSPPSVLLFEA